MSALIRLLPLILAALLAAPPAHAQAAAPAGAATPAVQPNANLTSPIEAARAKIADAVKLMNAGNVDGSLADLSQAIQLKPDSAFAYLLRGSIYTQKKMFPEAQADFAAADKINPNNPVIKFNLSELKFMQKNFDDARAGFVPLQKDSDMGDFATYKVFLCDLFAGHEDVAKAELDAFNKKGEGAGYYFANAAWALYHKDIEKGRYWLEYAASIYESVNPKKFTNYGESLRYFGYLPLPAAKAPAAKP